MDIQESKGEVSPFNQIETEIKGFIEGNTQPYLKVIDNTSAEDFYTTLKEEIESPAFEEYKPRIESLPLGVLQFNKVVQEMHIGGVEYHEGVKGVLIDTSKTTVGVVALDLSDNRISLLVKSLSNRDVEDFRNLRPNTYAHKTIGS